MLVIPVEAVARALRRDVSEIETEIVLMGFIPSPLIGEEMYAMLAERLGVAPEPATEPTPEPASPSTKPINSRHGRDVHAPPAQGEGRCRRSQRNAGAIVSDKLTKARELVLTVAPELARAPLYVVPLPPNEGLRGFCSRSVEAAFYPSLVATGEWRGPGTLMAIADEGYDEATLGVALHEAAHALPFAPPAAPTDFDYIDYTPEVVAHAERLLSAVMSLPGEPPKRCFWHGPPFVRICVHLQHRAAIRGFEIPFPEILQGWHYEIPPLVRFARALADEPEKMLTATFDEILATPAPAEFTKLFD